MIGVLGVTPRLLAALAPSATPTATSGDGGGGGSGADGGVESFGDAVDTAVREVQDLLTGLASALPRIAIGLLVFAVFWAAGRVARRLLRPRLIRLEGESIGRILSSVVNGFILGLGAFAFASIAFPSVNMSTVLGAGGVLALAAGFAFQDLLENMMAGVLLLVRKPFEEGDTVEVDGAVGVVEAITIRETRIRQFDRQVVVVPNAQVYKNAIRIQTERETIRSSMLVGVGYTDDLDVAQRAALDALATLDGVLEDPAPEALFTEFGDSSIGLDLRYFHASGQADLRRIQSDVVKAVKKAFDEQGVDIPFPIRTLDATDEVAAAMRVIAGDGRGRHDDGAGTAVGQG